MELSPIEVLNKIVESVVLPSEILKVWGISPIFAKIILTTWPFFIVIVGPGALSSSSRLPNPNKLSSSPPVIVKSI